ncbi:MAG: hypothetical protein H6P99_625 [Holophagaceae bacterium]|nr:hypothetical protein [Holophagaceae bacterium]
MPRRTVCLIWFAALALFGGTPPMDGALRPETWAGARREHLSGGGDVWLMESGAYLEVMVRGPAKGFPTVFVGDTDQVEVLHASAALGNVSYIRTHGTWARKGVFEWQVRDRAVSAATLAKEAEAFLEAQGWLANASRTGEPTRVFRIALKPSRRFIGVVFLSTDTMAVSHWPAGLRDDCLNLALLRGESPDALQFNPVRWFRHSP